MCRRVILKKALLCGIRRVLFLHILMGAQPLNLGFWGGIVLNGLVSILEIEIPGFNPSQSHIGQVALPICTWPFAKCKYELQHTDIPSLGIAS